MKDNNKVARCPITFIGNTALLIFSNAFVNLGSLKSSIGPF